MVIKRKNDKSIEDIIKDFIDDELLLESYTKINNLSSDNYDAKYTIRLGKRINKNLEIILQSEDGLNKFIELLGNNNPFIRFISARFLYPILPNKTIKIMIEYKNAEKSTLEKHNIENIINGLKSNQPVFMNQFKKLYNTEDLESLNRE